MATDADVYKLYVESIVSTIRAKYPGILVNNKIPGEILCLFVAEQQNDKTVTIDLGHDGPNNDNLPKLELDCRPYAVDRRTMRFKIEIANPNSKELIIQEFESNLRKWVAEQRKLMVNLDNILSAWEAELNK